MIRRLSWVILAILALIAIAFGAHARMDLGLVNNSIPDDIFSEQSLDVQILSPTDYYLNDSLANESLSLAVTNPANLTMDVYLALHRHDRWQILKKLGSVEPRARENFSYPLNFSYDGKPIDLDEFGVLGKTGNTYLGYNFSLREHWGGYEGRLRSTLSGYGLVAAGILFGVLILVLGGVLSANLRMKAGYPGMTGHQAQARFWRDVRDALSLAPCIITSPGFQLFEIACGAVLVSIILFYDLRKISLDLGLLVFLIGGTAALFMPVIFIVLAWLGYYRRQEPFQYVSSMFTWGIMASLPAFLINTAASLLLKVPLDKGLAAAILAIAVAPAVEESLKGAGLFLLAGRRQFGRALEGLIFGFSIGMGFAAIENWLYFAANASPVVESGLREWVFDIVYRSIICSLGHACFTGTTGLFLGLAMARVQVRGFTRIGFLLGLPIAITLHSLFNFLSSIEPGTVTAFGVPVPIYDPVLTLLITALYLLIGAYLKAKRATSVAREDTP